MSKKIVLILIVISAILSLVQLRIGLGFFIGYIFSVFHFYLIETEMKEVMSQKYEKASLNFLKRMVRPLLLATPLLLAVVFPDYINIWGAFAGIMALKIIIVVDFLLTKKKG